MAFAGTKSGEMPWQLCGGSFWGSLMVLAAARLAALVASWMPAMSRGSSGDSASGERCSLGVPDCESLLEFGGLGFVEGYWLVGAGISWWPGRAVRAVCQSLAALRRAAYVSQTWSLLIKFDCVVLNLP